MRIGAPPPHVEAGGGSLGRPDRSPVDHPSARRPHRRRTRRAGVAPRAPTSTMGATAGKAEVQAARQAAAARGATVRDHRPHPRGAALALVRRATAPPLSPRRGRRRVPTIRTSAPSACASITATLRCYSRATRNTRRRSCSTCAVRCRFCRWPTTVAAPLRRPLIFDAGTPEIRRRLGRQAGRSPQSALFAILVRSSFGVWRGSSEPPTMPPRRRSTASDAIALRTPIGSTWSREATFGSPRATATWTWLHSGDGVFRRDDPAMGTSVYSSLRYLALDTVTAGARSATRRVREMPTMT